MPDAEVDWSAWIAEIERQAKAELRAYLAAKVRALLEPEQVTEGDLATGRTTRYRSRFTLENVLRLIEGSDPASPEAHRIVEEFNRE